MPVPAKVFYSYAHEDLDLCNRLLTHLASLRRSGLISEWHDRKIVPGSKWAKTIDDHVNSADVILLLISADFLASDYCHEIEMKRALERHAAGETIVLPVIIRPVDWKGTPFEDLQVLPTGSKPVTTWQNLDEAFADVARGVRNAMDSRHTEDGSSTGTRSSLGTAVKATRLLEGAAPTRIPVGHSRYVVGKISLDGSPGLQNELTRDDAYAIESTNVKVQMFNISFPVVRGVTSPINAIVKLKSPDFEPKEQQKDIELSSESESMILPFQVKAGQTGSKFVTLELLVEQRFITSRALRTESEDLDPPGGRTGVAPRTGPPDPHSWSVIASLALSVLAHAEAQRYHQA